MLRLTKPMDTADHSYVLYSKKVSSICFLRRLYYRFSPEFSPLRPEPAKFRTVTVASVTKIANRKWNEFYDKSHNKVCKHNAK